MSTLEAEIGIKRDEKSIEPSGQKIVKTWIIHWHECRLTAARTVANCQEDFFLGVDKRGKGQ